MLFLHLLLTTKPFLGHLNSCIVASVPLECMNHWDKSFLLEPQKFVSSWNQSIESDWIQEHAEFHEYQYECSPENSEGWKISIVYSSGWIPIMSFLSLKKKHKGMSMLSLHYLHHFRLQSISQNLCWVRGWWSDSEAPEK